MGAEVLNMEVGVLSMEGRGPSMEGAAEGMQAVGMEDPLETRVAPVTQAAMAEDRPKMLVKGMLKNQDLPHRSRRKAEATSAAKLLLLYFCILINSITMALFNSSNPTLSEKIFSRSIDRTSTDVMTVRGSIQKFGFLMFLVVAGAAYTWKLYYSFKAPTMMSFFLVGMIGGTICAFATIFVPKLAKYLSPAYALLEGFVLGGLSAIVNESFKAKYPNIIVSAVLLTFGVAFAVFLLYNFRVIRATNKFRAVILSSMIGIAIFYLIDIVLGLFGINIPFMNWGDNSLIGIVVNLFIVVIAALSLVLNFDQIETGERMGAPKYMEWYGAFGLLITLVWLYLEILQLLSRFSNNRS